MKTILFALMLTACAADGSQALTLAGAAGSPDVGVSQQPACGPEYTYIVSNNGAAISDNSYKTRALRSFLNLGKCSGSHSIYTCAADTCTATSTSTSPYALRVTSCFDLPSCAAWACRQCTLESKINSGSAWTTGVNTTWLQYQQGYGVAKFIYASDSLTFATARIIPTTGIHYGD